MSPELYAKYEKYRNEVDTLLQTQGCIVYNTDSDQFLKAIQPVSLGDFDSSPEVMLAYMFADINLGKTSWTDERDQAAEYTTILSLGYALHTLLWENIINSCTLLVIGDDTFITLLSMERDSDFIHNLVEEIFEC